MNELPISVSGGATNINSSNHNNNSGGLLDPNGSCIVQSPTVMAAQSSSSAAGSSSGIDGAASPFDDSTSDVEIRVKKAADQSCWSSFVILSFLALGLVVVGVWSQWQSSGGAVQTHSLEYFVLCMIGGVLSGLPHFILTPVDQVKCRMQTGEFSSLIDGLRHVWNTAGTSINNAFLDHDSVAASTSSLSSAIAEKGKEKGDNIGNSNVSLATRISALYRGWAATFIGYSLQGALKMSLYEYFKWTFKSYVGAEAAKQHQVLLFLAASCCAETCADVFLAPWEAVKVKIQTNSQIPPVMSAVVPRMFRLEGFHGFFKGLPPLWMRQVPYSMTKFATFEKTVEFMYLMIIRAKKADVSQPVQLAVSLASGFVAGVFCTLVSHPADSVVSKLNQKVGGAGAWQVAQELGCNGLWKGIWARIVFIGTLTAMQWLIYDSFKIAVGLSTSGGGVAPGLDIPAGSVALAVGDHHVGRLPHHPRGLS